MLADRDESQETANRTKRFLSGREKYTRPITRHAARHASALATRTSMSLSTAHGARLASPRHDLRRNRLELVQCATVVVLMNATSCAWQKRRGQG